MRSHLALLYLLLLGLIYGLTACGEYSPSQPQDSATNGNEALTSLKQLEQFLNQGELDQALALFASEAELVEVQPTYLLSQDGTATNYTRQLSYGDQLSYKGAEWIKAYFFSLVYNKFHSVVSSFSQEGEAIIWQCEAYVYDAQMQIEFKATFANSTGKILFLSVTNRELVNLTTS